MAESAGAQILRDRAVLAIIGALAGVAAWLLIEVLPDRLDDDRLILLIAAATGGFFSAFLAATGPLSFARAALAAALSALPAAGLLYWASFRFAVVEDFIEAGPPPVAFIIIVSIGLPFLIAAQRPDEGWRHYPALFTEAWNIVVRYCAAWIFTGLFWGVVALSHALLGLVGLDIIEQLLDIEPVPYVLTGLVLGLAMAVVVELSDYVSPFLILRLLRLLLPVVLLVTAVFLLALPVQGLSDLFGGISAAATLMAMALGIATLITSALDRTDDYAAEHPVTLISTQLLALAMPVLALLAIYAIWLRVADYGWTPHRIAAVTAGVIVLGYAVFYALAVALRRNWKARIRGANIVMALAAVAVSALWLTPLLNPQRISAENQLARFEAGKVAVDKLDLWFLGKELGVAGEQAIARLRALDHPESERIAARIDQLDRARSRYGFERDAPTVDRDAMVAELFDRLPVLPGGAALAARAFDGVSTNQVKSFLKGCDKPTPGGHPGCVALVADFVPDTKGDEVMLFYAIYTDRIGLNVLWPEGGNSGAMKPIFLQGHQAKALRPELIDTLHAGDFKLAPPNITALSLEGAQIIVDP